MSTGQRNARLDAFANCGAGCYVQVNAAGDDLRVSAHHCHDRFCVPCQTGRASRICGAVTDHLEGRTTRWFTLTLRASDTPLVDQLDRLYASFKALRRRKWFASCCRGGAAFLEVKIGANSGAWHPHLHVLFEGSYVPQGELSAQWHAVTGDSFIVHVAAVADHESRCRYVTKYVTKPASSEVFEDTDKLQELVVALKGRRLCFTFGTWRGLQLDPDDETAGPWTSVGRVEDIFSRAAAGEDVASRWVDALERKFPGIRQHFATPPPPAPAAVDF